jgi:hypothetical protein
MTALLSRPGTKQRDMEDLVLAEIRRREAAVRRAERAGVEFERELPTSLRFLFYGFEQRGLINKQRPQRADGKIARLPSQYLTEAVTRLRDAGLIPWDYITDETRSYTSNLRPGTLREQAENAITYGQVSPWPGTTRPVILCESRGVAAVLRDLAYAYGADLAGLSGQCRGFLVTKIAPALTDDTRVLYLGDLDDVGNQIEWTTRGVLEQATGRTFIEETWLRVALTEAQIPKLKRMKDTAGKPLPGDCEARPAVHGREPAPGVGVRGARSGVRPADREAGARRDAARAARGRTRTRSGRAGRVARAVGGGCAMTEPEREDTRRRPRVGESVYARWTTP